MQLEGDKLDLGLKDRSTFQKKNRTRRRPAGMLIAVFCAVLCVALPAGSLEEARPATPRKVTEREVRQYLASHPKLLKELVEQEVHLYLVDHPEAVVEAMQRYQVREDKKRAKLTTETIVTRHAELYSDPMTPVAGAAGNAVQIVEFFDYRCAFCKRVDPAVRKLLSENPGLQMVFKEFPVLGPDSVLAAKASAAAYRQGVYLKFHDALMSESGPLTPEAIDRIAARFGLDMPKFKADMNSPDVAAMIDHTHQLAEALQIDATPTFIIGGEVVRGALDVNDLRARIAKVQAQ